MGDALTVVINGQEYEIPNTVETELDILRAVQFDPNVYALYWDEDVETLGPEQRAGAWEDDLPDSLYNAPPVVVSEGDEFVVVPKTTNGGREMGDDLTAEISLWDRIRSRLNMHANCQNCGIAFNIRDPIRGIRFADPSSNGVDGACPVCQLCFEELSADEVTQCFREMWDSEWPWPVDPEAVERFRENAEAIKNGDGEWMVKEGLNFD